MAQEEKIVPICQDFTNHECCQKIASILAKNNLLVHTLYVSNVYDWLELEASKKSTCRTDDFEKSLKILIHDNTLIIDGISDIGQDYSTREPHTIIREITQNIFYATDPQSKEPYVPYIARILSLKLPYYLSESHKRYPAAPLLGAIRKGYCTPGK